MEFDSRVEKIKYRRATAPVKGCCIERAIRAVIPKFIAFRYGSLRLLSPVRTTIIDAYIVSVPTVRIK